MNNSIIIVLLLILLVIIVKLSITKEGFQTPPANGYIEACNELNIKRTILKTILNNLSTNVQDISANLINSYNFKRENMSFQNNYLNYCTNNLETNDGCKILASTDKYPLKELPDLDVFYFNVLNGSYDIQNLLNRLNYYSDLIQCPRDLSTFATKDASDNQLNVSRDIGDIDTTYLFLELQKLSPYYLSPDVISYILRFLISKEKLQELNYTSSDYIRKFGLAKQEIINRLR